MTISISEDLRVALIRQADLAQTKPALIAKKREETRRINLERLSHDEARKLKQVAIKREIFESNHTPGELRNCTPCKGECEGCGTLATFQCGRWRLCGECRFWYRHGTHPVRDSGFGIVGPSDIDEKPVPAPHTLGRHRHQYCRTMTAYLVLREILDEFDHRFRKPDDCDTTLCPKEGHRQAGG